MPGAIPPPTVAAPPRPLPVSNLGQIQPPGAGGIPPYNVEAARRAQVLSLAGAATGHQVPAYLAEQAGLPNKAVEQQWALQKELYSHQLGAAQAQWNAASELQKQQIAHQYGLDTEQYKSELGIRAEMLKQGQMIGPDGRIMVRPGFAEATGTIEGAKATATQEAQRQRELDTPKEYTITDPATNTPRTIIATPRQMQAGTNQPGMPPGYQSGPDPRVVSRIEIDKKLASDAADQYAIGQRSLPLLDQVIGMANSTPSGHAAPVAKAVAAVLSSFGIPVSEGMSNAEVMQAVSQQLIPTVRQPGAQSNKEMDNYLATVPGISQSPAGRIQLAMMNKAMIARAGEIASIRRNNLGADDLDAKLAVLDNKPLFTPQQHAVMQAAQGRRIMDDATFDLLPVGMPFVDAKGNHTFKRADRTPAQ
jgi:hypothetical protein